MMLCNHQTDYFLETIVSASGRRYSSFEEPLVGRNISRDDVAGFFRTLRLTEEHQLLFQIVNHYQIAGINMIISALGIKFNQFKNLRETCLLTGLIFENQIKTEDQEYFWYMVDTGGVYALEEMGVKYNALPFTADLAQKYKQYLRSQFASDVAAHYDFINGGNVKDQSTGLVYSVTLLEEVRELMAEEYKSTIFLVDLEVLAKLGINDYLKDLALTLQGQNNKFYDLSKKAFLQIEG